MRLGIGSRARCGRGRHPGRPGLGLEPLEDRRLPSTMAAGSDPAAAASVATITTLTPDLGVAAYGGQPVTFTIGLAAADGSAPGGDVAIVDNGSTIATVPLADDVPGFSGDVSIPSIPGLVPGWHVVTAVYQGAEVTVDGQTTDYAPSTSPAARFNVGPTIAGPAGVQPAVAALTYTVVVARPADGATGTVSLIDNSTPVDNQSVLDGQGAAIDTEPVVDGKAVFTTSLAVGSHWVAALYSGDAEVGRQATNVLGLVVIRPTVATTTTLTASPDPALVGQPIILTAEVDSAAGPAGGDVTFYEDETRVLGTAPLDGAGGATLTVPAFAFAVGDHGLTASYPATVSTAGGVTTPFGASDSDAAPVGILVGPTLYESPFGVNRVPGSQDHYQTTFGEPVTFTAGVTSSTAPATGTVTFLDEPGAGLPAVALGTVPVVNGEANFTTATLGASSHTIVAHYNGDAALPSGDSPPIVHRVDASAGVTTPLAVTSTPDPSAFGQPVTFTAQFTTPAYGYQPPYHSPYPYQPGPIYQGVPLLGVIVFTIDGRDQPPLPVDDGEFTTSTLAAGTHEVTARYIGTSQIDSASPANTLEQVVQPPPPPALPAVAGKAIDEGSLLEFPIVAAHPIPGVAVSYSLAPGAPGGSRIDPRTGVFRMISTRPGRYAVTVFATDDRTPPRRAATTFVVLVRGVAPAVALGAVAPISGAPVLRDSGSFASPSTGPFLASVDYGDGTGPHPLALGPSRRFALAHAYAYPGRYTVKVSVEDGSGLVGRAALAVSVSPPPASGFGAGRDGFVTALYRDDLGRAPDAAGLRFWSGRLFAGVRPEAVARAILTSPEHRALVGRGLVMGLPLRRTYADALIAGGQAARARGAAWGR